MKLITVTLNPAIDKTIEVDCFYLESLNKVASLRHDIGGKGINVSRVLNALGSDSIAVGFVAGGAGHFITQGLNDIGIENDFVTVSGETRTNLKIFDRSSRQITEINEPGPEVTKYDLMSLAFKIGELANSDCLIVLSGSIPKHLNQDSYVGLIELAKSKGAKVFLDADGESFKLAVEAMPHMIKPNREELERYFGTTLASELEIVRAMDHFIEKGIEHVFVTMGSQGAYYSSKEGAYKMDPLAIKAHSSVGAGDAFVGAVCHAISRNFDVEQMLRWGVATSAGAAVTLGTNPAPLEWVNAHVQQVTIKKIGGVSL
ncbi:MAG TPA: 1-phosphofructokinase [Clostridiales bacterium UBA8960]|jgi:1-phosphofructokinase|nr:1-phosphofructokinase [Clostridiales bacterium UBA8960]